jgi:hypothetical protein
MHSFSLIERTGSSGLGNRSSSALTTVLA